MAVDYLTDYSVRAGDSTVKRWKKLGEFLLYRYLDGNVKDELGHVTHPGYPESWYGKVADVTGDHLRMRKLKREEEQEAAKKEAQAAKRTGVAEGILILLTARGVDVGGEARTKIQECEDLNLLQSWLVRAATAEAAGDLFDEE